MSLSYREQILLSVLLVVALIVGGYYLVFEPMGLRLDQVRTERINLQQEYDRTMAELKGLDDLIKKTTDLEAIINDRTQTFFPSIIQEELILMLHQLSVDHRISYEAEGYNFTFTPDLDRSMSPASTETTSKTLAELKQDYEKAVAGDLNTIKPQAAEPTSEETIDLLRHHISSLQGLTLTLDFESTYQNTVEMISSIEGLNRTIQFDNLNFSVLESPTNPLLNAENSVIEINPDEQLISGSIDLTFYAIPKLVDQDEDYLSWDLEPNTGKTDPFQA